MYVKIQLKRVDEVTAGDIIRTPKEPGHYLFPAWAQAIGVEVKDMTTKITTLRPATTDGKVTVDNAGRVQQVGTTVPSWELVEVQTKISASGNAR
jgi:hypothetical protein